MVNRSALFSRRYPGGVWTIQDMLAHPGNIFFVDSGASGASDAAGYGLEPDRPFATLDYAIGQCTANNGDVIYLMPGHAENLGADSAVDVDVNGLKIVGLGHGATRPTFTCTAAAGDFKLAGTSTWIENILFLNDVDQSTGLLEVSSTDCVIKNVEIREVDVTAKQANVYLITTANADRLLIDGLAIDQDGASTAGAVTAIDFVGADGLELKNFYVYGNFSTTPIQMLTTKSERVHIHDGVIWQLNSADTGIVDTVTASTGFIGPNLFIRLADDAANVTEAITGATFHVIDPVYVVNADNQKALLINWTATADA